MTERPNLSTTKRCMKCKAPQNSTFCDKCNSQSPDIIGHCFNMNNFILDDNLRKTANDSKVNYENVFDIYGNESSDDVFDVVCSGLTSPLVSAGSDVPIYCNEVNNHLEESDSDYARFDTAMTTKIKEELNSVIVKMIATEQEYVSSLESTVNSYKSSMDTRRLAPVADGDKDVLFENIERIYEFHRRCFSPELNSFKRSPLEVGSCFLKWKSHFSIYTMYNKNKPRADQLWNDIFFRAKTNERRNSVDVGNFLLKPAQRLKEYSQFLKDLAYCCHSMDPRLRKIINAHALIEFQIRHANDLQEMEAIENADVILAEQGCLLRQDDFHVYYGHYGVIKRARRVFLFEKAIVFTKIRKQKGEEDTSFLYQHSIKTDDLGLTETIGKSDVRFEILQRKGKKGKLSEAYILQASSTIVKKSWTDDINRILSQSAVQTKKDSFTEAVTKINEGRRETMDVVNKRAKARHHSGEFNENFVRENVFRQTTDYEPRRKPKPPRSIEMVW